MLRVSTWVTDTATHFLLSHTDKATAGDQESLSTVEGRQVSKLDNREKHSFFYMRDRRRPDGADQVLLHYGTGASFFAQRTSHPSLTRLSCCFGFSLLSR
jgi:hypothetical protein